jgi:hypothetical protein
MHPSPAVSYELAQARIADRHHQARRENLARTAQSRSAQSGSQARPSRMLGHLRLRLAHRAG